MMMMMMMIVMVMVMMMMMMKIMIKDMATALLIAKSLVPTNRRNKKRWICGNCLLRFFCLNNAKLSTVTKMKILISDFPPLGTTGKPSKTPHRPVYSLAVS